jgi:hypothetical protein
VVQNVWNCRWSAAEWFWIQPADYLIKKLGEIIDKSVSFFKNVFIKHFSISYAKRIGAELKKFFTD